MPTIADMRFEDLLAGVAAKSPTPGGGAVAAATGALSASLAGMVVAYSIGRKALAQHDAELRHAESFLTNARALFLELAEEDARAYGAVNELSRLPEDHPRRAAEYAGAVEASVRVPQAAIAASVNLLRLYERLAAITNPHLRSDLAIAAVLAASAARSSEWNVRVNAPQLGGAARRESALAAAREAVVDAEARRDRVEAASAQKP